MSNTHMRTDAHRNYSHAPQALGYVTRRDTFQDRGEHLETESRHVARHAAAVVVKKHVEECDVEALNLKRRDGSPQYSRVPNW